MITISVQNLFLCTDFIYRDSVIISLINSVIISIIYAKGAFVCSTYIFIKPTNNFYLYFCFWS